MNALPKSRQAVLSRRGFYINTYDIKPIPLIQLRLSQPQTSLALAHSVAAGPAFFDDANLASAA
ncbi:hypothetical protein [Herminiimonas aquatilis]|uniref:Uncharacterized protein n=1 Tax=Herminiimonas aquatilis TaxID=345342 RepID=A0ABW2J3F0_9BURK